jgi:hypothetical protein
MKFVLTAFFVAFVATISASTINPKLTWYSIESVRSCGAWVNVRESGERIKKSQTESWMVGYLSGMARTNRDDFLAGIDAESALLYVDKYCRDNPLLTPLDAALLLSQRRQR